MAGVYLHWHAQVCVPVQVGRVLAYPHPRVWVTLLEILKFNLFNTLYI